MVVYNSLLKGVILALTLLPQDVLGNAEENFEATYGISPAPFKINVRPEFIAQTLQKVSLTRYTRDIDQPDLVDGPRKHNVSTVRDYWVNQYNWFDVQDYLNKRYNHFTTSVLTGPQSNFSNPIPLHFIHHRSNRTDAIPLLFLHGWPGSFMEVDHILDGLLSPPSPSLPAFHVIAPSIPGFAFSPAPTKPGFGARETGYAFHALMQQLNYTKYVVQGGDFGGFILRYIAGDNPTSVISALSNFWIIPPNTTDLQRYSHGLTTADENTTIQIIQNYETQLSGYRFVQQTRPLALAVGMTDSPVGFAMWIYDLMLSAVDRSVWGDEIL
ncbi:MAG: hypothetical protein Q9219_007599 [cf. Caloplaca sp. 3 TL-2023]